MYMLAFSDQANSGNTSLTIAVTLPFKTANKPRVLDGWIVMTPSSLMKSGGVSASGLA
jgi:hypothetical protein